MILPVSTTFFLNRTEKDLSDEDCGEGGYGFLNSAEAVHAGQPQPGFVTRNGHGVEPTLVEMVAGHPNELIENRPKARQVPRVEQITRF